MLYRSMSLVLLCLSVSLLLAGCTGIEEPDLGQVSGVVKVDGTPTAGLVVLFVPKGEGGTSTGTTDAEGRYELSYKDGVAKGAAIGEHSVRITRSNPGGGPAGGPEGTTVEDLPARYNTNSELTATVKAGENPPIDFDL